MTSSPSLAQYTRGAAQQVIAACRAQQQTLATCESLTAGLVASTLAQVPGASAVLRGGLITYATDLKATLAGVPADYLAHYGPIDPGTAAAMAYGALGCCESSIAVSCTGVAGPDKQDEHPVGEVYVAVAQRLGSAEENTQGARLVVAQVTQAAALAPPARPAQSSDYHEVPVGFRAIWETTVTRMRDCCELAEAQRVAFQPDLAVSGDREWIRQATVLAAFRGIQAVLNGDNAGAA